MKNLKLGITLFATGMMTFGCGKSSDSDTSSSTAGMPSTLSLGCGDSGTTNCFEQGVTALAGDTQLSSDQGQLETMLLFSWMTVGFPSAKSTYYDTNIGTPGGTIAKKTIPKEGMVSRIEGTRKEIVDAASKTISMCTAAPTSGTFTTANGVAVTWTTPTMSVPGDHPKASKLKYDKAVTAKWTDSDDKTLTFEGRFEFMCDYNAMAMMVALSESGTEKNRIVFFYDRDTSTKLYADTYLYDATKKFSSDPALWLVFQMRGSDSKKFKAWTNRVGTTASGKAQGYRYAINADYSVPSISFYAVEVGTGSNQSTTEAEFLASANSTSSAVTGGVAPSAGNGTSATQGCSDSWMKKGSALTTSTTCSGLDLAEAPAFFWDSASKGTLATMYSSGKDKINGISK